MNIRSSFSSFIFLLLFIHSICYGSQVTGKVVSEIIIEGNVKTRQTVILRELDFKPGDILTDNAIANSLRKLKNLRIFEDVSIQHSPESNTETNDRVKIQINVRDRWTIIPIAKIGGGGGSKYYTIGVFDANLFGRYLEVGTQYQNINGKSGGVLWFRNPRFLGNRFLLGLDLWHFRIDQPVYADDGALFGTYNNIKNRLHIFVQKEVLPWFFFGGGLDIVSDEFSDVGLTDDQKETNVRSGFISPDNAKQNFIELNLQFGELNFDKYLVEGFQIDIDSRLTTKKLGSDDNSAELVFKSTYFKKFKYQQNVGINVVIGTTSSSLTQNQFYIGGLFEVRGYVDRRFQGSNYWRSNIEYRVPSYRSRWFVLQHVAFIDFGKIGNSISQLITNDSKSFSSIGVGLRFISPKVYRFNARLDFAQTYSSEQNFDISFGLQQFF